MLLYVITQNIRSNITDNILLARRHGRNNVASLSIRILSFHITQIVNSLKVCSTYFLMFDKSMAHFFCLLFKNE